jgi:hypothetical protein
MKKSLLDLVCSMYFSPFCFGAVRSNGLEIFLSCEWRAPAYSLVVCRPETDFPAARNLFPFVFCVGHCAAFTSLAILSFGLDFLPQEHCAHLGESFFFSLCWSARRSQRQISLTVFGLLARAWVYAKF